MLKYLLVGIVGCLSATVVNITSENFQSEVIDSKVPVVLDAYTEWCHYCKNVAPVFSDLSNEMEGKVKFAKLNIEAHHNVAKALKIEALPTFLFYQDGKVVDRQAGAMNKSEFNAKLHKVFPSTK